MTAQLRAVPAPAVPTPVDQLPDTPQLSVNEVCWLELAAAHLEQLAERARTTRAPSGDVVLLTTADARWLQRTAVRLDLLAERVGA